MGVIYLRTNLANGMQYVGQTKDISKRNGHWNCFKLRYANQLLNDDREKYGLGAFKLDILEECDDSRLDELERLYIEKYDTLYPNGYNCNKGGTISFVCGEYTKQKISEANSGEKNGMYGKTPWNKNVPWSDEVKQKLSESHIGNKSALGHRLNDEQKERISKSKKGKPNKKLSKPLIQIDENGTITEWESVADASRNGYKGVDRVCRGERPKAYGCKWYYKDDYNAIIAEQTII